MELNLKGKTALVCASSQGLGRAIALQLAKEGANVMISSRSAEMLELAVKEIRSEGTGEVAYTVADLIKKEEIQNLVTATAEAFGGIDIVINNAGGPPAGTIDTLTDEDWQASFELNLMSYVRVIKESLPYLRVKGGRIINIASSSIKEPIPGLLLSNTFRAGIVGLSKTLSQELAKDGILINTVAPGRIDTDRVRYLDEMNAKKQGISAIDIYEKSIEKIPLKRYGTPEEFAKVVTFLVSDANGYMTGSSLLVDGGMIKSL